MRRKSALSLVIALALSSASVVIAQERVTGRAPAPRTEVVTLVAEDEYSAGRVHTFFFGRGYRDLWATPIRVPVLDMEHTAGGLQARFRVGGLQTHGLALTGADGKSYTFRGVDKDPSEILPPELIGTPFEDLIRDQISSSLPGAALVANPIARAAGIPQTETRLVVLPDSPRLGEFREEFAGRLGTFDEYPQAGPGGTPGTFGLVEVVDGREMLDRITAGWGPRVDVREYLRARLVDLLLGDWDRHVGQWRFARFPDSDLWTAIPEDRDQAFSRYEGLVIWLARDREPKFDVFGPEYTPLEGLAWNARVVDRRLLAGARRALYRQLAGEIRDALSDRVLAEAVDRMPEAYRALRGDELLRALRARRDGLVQEAERFYEFLARQVDVRTTNASEVVTLERAADGDVTLTAFPAGAERLGEGCDPVPAGLEPAFRRRFVAGETAEVRLYLGTGPDRVLVSGPDGGGPQVRVIGGGDGDVLCHGPTGRTFVFGLTSPTGSGKGEEVAQNLWIPPGESIEHGGSPAEQQGRASEARRDWGSTTYRVPWFGVAPEIGLFLGTGVAMERFGFRRRPFTVRHQFRAGFSFGTLRPRFDYLGEYHLENRRTYFRTSALISGIEAVNFFGFGNETDGEESDFFRVRQSQLAIESRIEIPLGARAWLSTGPVLRYVSTDDDTKRLIGQLRPYGIASTGQLGWVVGAAFSNREFPGAHEIVAMDDVRRLGPPAVGPGVSVDVDARYYPDLWNLDRPYLAVEGVTEGWVHFGRFSPAVGVRIGGKKNFGDAPYFDAAYLGGRQLRGLPIDRFVGDSVLHGTVGLLLDLGEMRLVVPGRVGVLVQAGAGRVWADGESSNRWHTSYGAGVWWAPWTMSNAVRLAFAQSDEGPALYLLSGFGF